jgi:hypothetical protein
VNVGMAKASQHRFRGMTKNTPLTRLEYLAVLSAGILVFSSVSGATYLLVVRWSHLLQLGSTKVVLEDTLCAIMLIAGFSGMSHLTLVASHRLGAWYHNEHDNMVLQTEKFGAVSAGLGLNVMSITGTWLLSTRLGSLQLIGAASFAAGLLLTIYLAYLAICDRK